MRPRNGGAGGRGRPRPPVSRSSRAARSSYAASRYVHLRRPVVPLRPTFGNVQRHRPRVLVASYPPAVVSIANPACTFQVNAVASQQSLHVSPIRRVVRAPGRLVLGTIMGVVGGLISIMKFVSGIVPRRPSDDIVDATEAENKSLHEQVQALKKELVNRDQQVESLKKANSVYVLERIPQLRNQIKQRDELLNDVSQAGGERGGAMLVNLHNRLASKDSTIAYLRSIKSKSNEVVEDIARQMRHKETQMTQVREQLADTTEHVEQLMQELNEREELIVALSGRGGAPSETATLEKHIFKQAQVIEGLKNGIDLPSSVEHVSLLQKQVADQDFIISTLRRRLEYSAGDAQVVDTFFFPDDRVRSTLYRLTQFLSNVEESLDLCVSNIVCSDLTKAIIASHKQGVTVRIITDDEDPGKASDIQKIAAEGIPVKFDKSRPHLQHNFFIADGRLVGNGSFSWSMQAVRYNRENLTIFHDPRLVKSFSSEFHELWSIC